MDPQTVKSVYIFRGIPYFWVFFTLQTLEQISAKFIFLTQLFQNNHSYHNLAKQIRYKRFKKVNTSTIVSRT